MADRPLRILHLTLGADAGGLSRYIVSLGSAMVAQGHDVTAAGDTGAWQWAFDQAPFPYVKIPLKGGLFSFWKSVRELRAHVRERPVDIIHTHYRRATLLARRLQGAGQAGHAGTVRSAAPGFRPDPAQRKIPILYTVHLSHISLKFPRNLLTDFGDHTHVASPEAQAWVTGDAGVDPKNVTLIPHGVDVHRYAIADDRTRNHARAALSDELSFPLTTADRIAAYVGRLDQFHPKNIEWIVDLAARTRQTIPNAKFLLVGEGPQESLLRERIASLNLADRVHLTGHRDPLRIYQAADALLLPSAREGFSLVCAEAMSVGVPCLRTRTSGTAQLIVQDVTGRSVPVDREAFIDAAAQFLSDAAALRTMGANAARLIREKFTFDQQVARTLDLYRSLARL
jgi:glycosyltransferase involved in cell wall biosynthesis